MNKITRDEGRVLLAEKMGWNKIHESTLPGMGGVRGYLPHMSVSAPLPNPWESADDDYAVLEFWRKDILWLIDNNGHLPAAIDYDPGDYATALLSVMGYEVE